MGPVPETLNDQWVLIRRAPPQVHFVPTGTTINVWPPEWRPVQRATFATSPVRGNYTEVDAIPFPNNDNAAWMVEDITME